MIKNNNSQKRFIIYTRCSTDDQARGEFTTLDAQELHCKNMLEALGYILVRTEREDGYSGKDLKRPAVQRILKEVGSKDKSFDGVIFFRLDRLTRNPRDLYSLIDLFKENEVEFVSVRENLDSSTAVGRIMIGMIGLLSSFEREMIGERVSASAHARVQQGLWPGSRLAHGYKRIPNGQPLPNGRQPKRIVPDEEVVPVIQRIFEMAAANKSLYMIGKALQDDKIKSARGIYWRPQSLLMIIRNPFYKGYISWNDKIYPGQQTAIISASLWEKANKAIKLRFPKHEFRKQVIRHYIYLLEGLMRCGHCNSRLLTNYGTSNTGRKFFYYQCSRSKQGLGCDTPPISATNFDEAVVDFFYRASKDQNKIFSAIKEKIRIAGENLAIANEKLKKYEKVLESKKEETNKLIDLALVGGVTQGSVYRERIDKLQSEVTELESEVAKIYLQQKVAEMSSNCGEYVYKQIVYAISNFDKLEPETKKDTLQKLIKEMIVYEDHIEIKMLIGDDLQTPIPEHPIKDERPDPKAEASATNDLCVGSTSHQHWLPRLDSNQNNQIQSLGSYQLDDRAINITNL